MDLIVILQAGVANGTVLLFATLGEIFAERSGVLNLGVEGMMLMGAMSAYSTAVNTGSPWLGLLVAVLVVGLFSQIHAFITIHLQADQVVSGLALTFLGAGASLVFGEGLSKAGTISMLPNFPIPLLEKIPIIGPIFFSHHSLMVYIGICSYRWRGITSTARGLVCICARLARTRLPQMRSVSMSTGCGISMCSSVGHWQAWQGLQSAWQSLRVGSVK